MKTIGFSCLVHFFARLWLVSLVTGNLPVATASYVVRPPHPLPAYMINATHKYRATAPVIRAPSPEQPNLFPAEAPNTADSSEHFLPLNSRATGYWLANMQHGQMPFAPLGYKVWRNVMDYGAKGDGVTDDTAAINAAITDGNRCGLGCGTTSRLGAVVFFPAGTYMISTPIIQYYYTQFIGDPTASTKPTIKGMPTFQGIALIDTDVYIPGDNGTEWYINQNQFYRQIRNLKMDLTAMPNQNTADDQTFVPTGIHWQVAQSTSLQNIDIVMTQGSTAVGIFTENGSGGFMSDITFFGGNIGMRAGSQQFTARALTFTNPSIAVSMIWDWGWTWQNVVVVSAFKAFECTNFGGPLNQGTGSLTVIDSHFTSVPFAITVTSTIQPAITLDNLLVDGNTPSVVLIDGGATLLAGTTGGAVTIQSWGLGRRYTDIGDVGTSTSGNIVPAPIKPAGLLNTQGQFFTRSKPQYETLSASSFINVASFGAVGDTTGDQSGALNAAFSAAKGAVVFIPAGVYVVASTVNIPVGTRVVGEAWSQIMGSGETFRDDGNPVPVVRVGNPGDTGNVEISDLLFTVEGPTAGAVLVEWNVKAASQGSAGMWDSHVRVGGATGSSLQIGNCPASSTLDINCKAASMLMHVTANSSGYFENNWLWVADHDLDTPAQAKVNVFVGRGLLVESTSPTWFWGGASEHSVLYQYQFSKAANVFIGHMQTESPYFQPTPSALDVFDVGVFPSDPTFSDCGNNPECLMAWALIIQNSTNIFIYGAGFYSFFQSYSEDCLVGENCQQRLVQTSFSQGIWMFSQYTKGSTECVSPQGGITPVAQGDNRNGFLTAISAWIPLALTGANIGGVTFPGNNPSPNNLPPVPALASACGTVQCGQTMTLTPACASAVAALPISGENNNPPGPDNCGETCDIYRLITGTCCGNGGSACFGINLPANQSVPAPFPVTTTLPPQVTMTIPGFDSTGSPTTGTYDSTHTPIPFPIVIPPGWVPIPPGPVGLPVPPPVDLPDDDEASFLVVLDEFDNNPWTDLDPDATPVSQPASTTTSAPAGPTPPSSSDGRAAIYSFLFWQESGQQNFRGYNFFHSTGLSYFPVCNTTPDWISPGGQIDATPDSLTGISVWGDTCNFSKATMQLTCNNWSPATCNDSKDFSGGVGGTCATPQQNYQALMFCFWGSMPA